MATCIFVVQDFEPKELKEEMKEEMEGCDNGCYRKIGDMGHDDFNSQIK